MRPGATPTGLTHQYRRDDENLDFLLADFDIDADLLKPAHEAQLNEARKFLLDDYALRVASYQKIFFKTAPIWTAFISGYASNTYGGKTVTAANATAKSHNSVLSAKRATSVQERMQKLFAGTPLQTRLNYKTGFHGFTANSAGYSGENPWTRSVRVAVSRPMKPPVAVDLPPAPQETLKSTSWQISLAGSLSGGKKSAGADVAMFLLVDVTRQTKALFAYRGWAIAPTIPIPSPPISANLAGKVTPFRTTKPVSFEDFEGEADYVQPPGAFVWSVEPATLTIKSKAFTTNVVSTLPRFIPIDTAFQAGIQLLPTFGSGTLTRIV